MTDLPPLSAAQAAEFERDGYLLVPGLFNAEETELLITAARQDGLIQEQAFGVDDRAGRSSRLSLWNHPGDDLWGAVCRCNRIVGGMEQLLGGEVYHYHSKMMLKEPRVGGAWEWHQDYGYWYNNGCLYPYMASCLIALDAATRENGCLQVLRGSHHIGRIEHGLYGGQTCADPERVEKIADRLELVYCELEPGTGLFFHGNTLHRSDANTSEHSRWSLICCYNAARNDPYKAHHHPCYTPLSKLPDRAVLETGRRLTSATDHFMAPQDDSTTEGSR
jgi:hypothetical protein